MANSAAVKDTAQFLDLLGESGLVTAEQLTALREQHESAKSPKEVARALVKDTVLSTWQATQLLAGWSNLTMGKYKLLKQLGKSQTGRVFLAEHTGMGRRVALKTLSRRHTSRPELVQSFLADARTAAGLDHRNIVHVYDVDQDDDRFFVITEYVEGFTLAEIVDKKGPISITASIDSVRQAARGLHHAHEQGIVHRDLKPSNLLRDRHGVMKIMDLGVGRLTDHTTFSSDDSTGAADYLAPEQLREDEDHVDGRTDIYSLGCILYFLVTGKPPFSSGSDQQRRDAHLSESPRPLNEVRSGLPRDLAAICDKMLAKSPADRYDSVIEVAEALDQWQAARTKPAEKPATLLETAAEAAEAAPFVALDDSDGDTPPMAKPLSDEEAAAFAIQAEGPAGTPVAGPTESAPVQVSRDKVRKAPLQLPLGLIIGCAAAAVVSLALLGALIWVLTRPASPVEVVNDDDPPAVASADPESDPENDPEDPEVDPEDPEYEDPEAPDPGGQPGEDPVGGLGVPAPDPADPKPEPADPKPADPKPDPADPKPDPADPKPADPKPEPTDPKPTDPKPTDPPPPDPKPTHPKPPDPKPTDPEPTDPKPADPKPPAEPPLPKKYEKPFSKMPTVVALPDRESQEPVVLGQIFLAPKMLCFIKLRGGVKAYKGVQTFELANGRRGTAEREWELKIKGSKALPADSVVANLKLDGDNLSFQWTAAAAEEPVAAHACNCLLSMNIGAETRQVALRQPVDFEAFALDLDKAAVTKKCPIPFAPRAEAIRVEVSKLDGEFPKHTLDPETPIPASKSNQWINLGEKPEEQVLLLRLETQMKKDLQLTVKPHFRNPIAKLPVPMTKSNVTKAQQTSLRARQQLAAQVEGMKAALKKIDRREASRRGLGAQVSLKEQQLAKAEAAVQAIEKLSGLYTALNKNGKIHFRIYYDADGGQVELVRTVAVAPSK